MIAANRQRGFTLIELMITLVIFAIITSLGYITMSGYLPKQRLIATGRYIESILQRAQSEAYSRSTLVGVHFVQNGTTTTGQVFIDVGAAAGGTDYARDTEPALTQMSFRSDVFFTTAACNGVTFTGGSCSSIASTGCYVFFNNQGRAVSPVAIGGGAAQGDQIDYELFIYSDKVDLPSDTSKSDTREIEALGSGMVAMIKQGQAGNSAGAQNAITCAE